MEATKNYMIYRAQLRNRLYNACLSASREKLLQLTMQNLTKTKAPYTRFEGYEGDPTSAFYSTTQLAGQRKYESGEEAQYKECGQFALIDGSLFLWKRTPVEDEVLESAIRFLEH